MSRRHNRVLVIRTRFVRYELFAYLQKVGRVLAHFRTGEEHPLDPFPVYEKAATLLSVILFSRSRLLALLLGD